MPRRHYPLLITEDLATLTQLEHRQRGHLTHPRIRLLWLLKSGQVPSIRTAVPLLGFSVCQLYRWWAMYQQGGLAAVLATKPHGHSHPRLTQPAWEGVCAAMRAGEIATIKDAQRYLADEWQITYSVSGLWWHLHQRRARPKTGRRRHQQANTVRQADYKRAVRRSAASP